MSADLAEFLLDRITEDERSARFMRDHRWRTHVLAECEAKRIVVHVSQDLDARLHAGEPGSVQWHEAVAYRTVLRTLAQPYSKYPDFDQQGKAHRMNEPRPKLREDGWPTRADIRYDTDAERLCRITVRIVESMGASVPLTNAVIHLEAARQSIADHVESGSDG